MDGGWSRPSALLLFVAGWQVMIAAMMLPASLRVARLFARVARGHSGAGAAISTFVAAYFAAWTGLALLLHPV
jgi:predicted metal-binding membrane protein